MTFRLPPSLRTLPFTVAFLSAAIPSTAPAQLTGDSVAIRHAERMLGALGGREAWARARTIAVELRGHIASDSNEWAERYWIDLEVPRGRYQIRAGGSERIIAWTAEGGWESRNGAIESQSTDRHALEQAYWAAELTVVFRRLAAARPATRLLRDTTDAGLSVITLLAPVSGDTIARLTLDAGGSPVHWAAPIGRRTFQRILGPLADYGGLRLPRWGATPDGLWRYEHLTASLSSEPPPVSFARPEPGAARPPASGLRGNPEAIEDARAMVDAMERAPFSWATTQYSYTLGPLERYGNLRVPKWATTAGGLVRYERVSLTGSTRPTDSTLFAPPRQGAPVTW